MPRTVLNRVRSALGKLRDMAYGDTTSYRPERHYMRGPGPAWKAKHGIFHKGKPSVAAIFPAALDKTSAPTKVAPDFHS